MKKVLSLFACMMLLFGVQGCSLFSDDDSSDTPKASEKKDKVYSDNGMKITIPSDFYKKDIASLTNYYESEEAIVTALKQGFKELDGTDLSSKSSLEDYAKAVLSTNKLDSKLYTSDNNKYIYFTYEKEVSGKDFYYMGVVYKTEDAFWLLNFACNKKDKSDYSDTFIKWANTVEFE